MLREEESASALKYQLLGHLSTPDLTLLKNETLKGMHVFDIYIEKQTDVHAYEYPTRMKTDRQRETKRQVDLNLTHRNLFIANRRKSVLNWCMRAFVCACVRACSCAYDI